MSACGQKFYRFASARRRIWNNLPVTPVAPTPDSWYLVACAAGAVLLLLLLIARVRLHPALALAVAALALGVAAGMPLKQVPLSFTGGVANLMGHIAIILGFGAILGRLVAASGGAVALGSFLVDHCGPKGLPWALMALGMFVGMPVFMEVGLVLLMPIVAEAARRSQRPPILVGMPLLAGLSIVHGTLPPHPAALLAAGLYHADLGRTILWGLAAGLPAAALAGPCLGWLMMRQWERRPGWCGLKPAEDASTLFAAPVSVEEGLAENPSTGVATPRVAIKAEPLPSTVGPLRAASAILLPIVLIFLGSWADALAAPASLVNQVLHFCGSPDIAMLIAVLAALLTLGPHIQTGRHHGSELLRQLTTESFEPIANVLVILAAAGGLSGVLRDSGAAHRGPGAWRTHAAVGAGMDAGSGCAHLHGLGDRGDGRGFRRPGTHGLAHGCTAGDAGAGHRHRLPGSFSCERPRVLDGPGLLQTRTEADAGDLDGDGDGAVHFRPGDNASSGRSSALTTTCGGAAHLRWGRRSLFARNRFVLSQVLLPASVARARSHASRLVPPPW